MINEATIIDEKLFIPDKKNLKIITDFNGIKLYTSDKLKKDYIESIKNSKYGNNIGPPIEKLVQSEEVIPCWLNKRLLSLTIFKLFSKSRTKNISGFYYSDKKKVYVIIDNNINLLTHASDDSIARITIHEVLHMISYKNPKKFYSIFHKSLYDFYDNYFEDLFELNPRLKSYTEDVLSFLIDLAKKPYATNTHLIQYGQLLKETYEKNSQLNEQQFGGVLYNFLTAAKIIANNPMNFINMAKKFESIIDMPIKTAYKNTFKKSPPNDVIFFQEIITPSEIISILSEMIITSEMINAIKLI